MGVADLDGLSLVMFREGYDLRSVTLDACRDAGVSPHLVSQGGEMDGVLAFVAAGLGAAVVPAIAMPSDGSLTAIPFTRPGLSRTVALAHRNDRPLPRPARALADELAGDFRGEGTAQGIGRRVRWGYWPGDVKRVGPQRIRPGNVEALPWLLTRGRQRRDRLRRAGQRAAVIKPADGARDGGWTRVVATMIAPAATSMPPAPSSGSRLRPVTAKARGVVAVVPDAGDPPATGGTVVVVVAGAAAKVIVTCPPPD